MEYIWFWVIVALPGLTWPPGDLGLTGEKLNKAPANRGQPDGRWGQILQPGGARISDNHQLANVSVMKPIWFSADGKRGPPKIPEGTQKGVPKEGHPKCVCEKKVVPRYTNIIYRRRDDPPAGLHPI